MNTKFKRAMVVYWVAAAAITVGLLADSGVARQQVGVAQVELDAVRYVSPGVVTEHSGLYFNPVPGPKPSPQEIADERAYRDFHGQRSSGAEQLRSNQHRFENSLSVAAIPTMLGVGIYLLRWLLMALWRVGRWVLRGE